MMKRLAFAILILMVTMIALSACAPDPRKEADAYATRSKADQSALDQEQQRQQDEQIHQLQLQELQTKQAHREAIQQRWNTAVNALIKATWMMGSAAIWIVGITLAISLSRTTYGLAGAATRAAQVRANTIYLDDATGQFPLLLQHVHGNKYALHNPNTGSVLMLDVTSPADRQLIATSGATQIAGVLAKQASASQDPAGVAMVRPPIVHTQDHEITLGADFLRDAIPLPGDEL